MSLRDRYFIESIDYKTAMDLVTKNHYLHRKAPCRQAFGLFEVEGNNGRLVGVVSYAIPASLATSVNDPSLLLRNSLSGP